MGSNLKGQETESAREVLERIRARLKEQIQAGISSWPGASPKRGDEHVIVARLGVLLDEIRSIHSRVGAVNSRPLGPIHHSIQQLKKALRRILAWYTRPIVQYQATTIQFLSAATEILERDQSRFKRLEAQVELLADELADMRQRTLAELDWIAQELTKRDTEHF